MPTRPLRVGLAFICLLLPGATASAQRDPWTGLRAKSSRSREFSLVLPGPRTYRQGEIILVALKFPGAPPDREQTPPGEMWQFGGFLIDPQVNCGSFQKPCLMGGGSYPDKSDAMLGFGRRSEPITTPLNSYLPGLAQGRYRVAALARKLVLTNRAPMSTTYGYADPPEYAVSNSVEFEVTPASADWIQETIEDSLAALKGPQPAGREAYEKRRAAAQQLRFLDNPAAWQESLALLPIEEGVLLAGLSATAQPKPVCELMQSRIPVPEQSVSSGYLSTLVHVCGRAHLPPPPSPAAPAGIIQPKISPVLPPPTRGAQPNPERQAYFDKQRLYHADLLRKTTASLAASLPAKHPEPKATAFATLIQYVQQVRNGPAEPVLWVASLTREFVRSFAAIDVARQRYLLELYASTIRSPELGPLLESVLDRWKPGDYYEAPQAALRALHRLDPKRAQARILAELRKPQTWLDTSQLNLLPAGAVPPMDDALIAALADAQREGGWNPQLRMAALAKYGSRDALPRVKAIYESQQVPCQPELIAYFLRVDPAYADSVFRREPWDMQAAPPPCTIQYFQRTPPLFMHAALEKYMAAYLMHRDVFVKTTAARQLGIYGSKAALAPLWDAFRYFHEYWKGKRAELAQNGEGVNLEVELRNAIARGRQWLATETDLRIIESLCTGERCLHETQQDLRALQAPLRIEIFEQPGGLRASIAQYSGLESVQDVKAKLAQFPRGTKFVIAAWGAAAEDAAAEIRSFASGRGIILATAPVP